MKRCSHRRWLFSGILFLWIQSLLVDDSFGGALEPKYRLEVEDRHNEGRFLITLVSLDTRLICIPIEKWPSRHGQLHFGETWVRLEAREGIYQARDTNFGYCIEKDGGPCMIRLKPGASLKGFIGYGEFGKVSEIRALKDRHLVFPVISWICESHRNGKAGDKADK
jgi:hypothetical protein